ncbi:MAG: CHASE2 domain-containing protein, partial [Methylococcaceae bacterium]
MKSRFSSSLSDSARTRRLWSSDWFLGLIILLAFLVGSRSELMGAMERSAYDFAMRSNDRNPGDKVAVIAIDDASIANIGRWPWSREVHAEMIDLLTQGKPKVIGHTVFFLEPQQDAGLPYIRELSAAFQQSALLTQLPLDMAALHGLLDEARAIDEKLPADTPESRREADPIRLLEKDWLARLAGFYAQSSLPQKAQDDAFRFAQMLSQAENDLNTDRKLAESLGAAGNVVLGMPYVLGEPIGKPDNALPAFVLRDVLSHSVDRVDAVQNEQLPLSTLASIPPIAELGEPAAAIGHLTDEKDVDGVKRNELLALDYYGQYFPAESLMIAAKSLNLGAADIELRLGEGIRLGKLNIGSDANLRMFPYFYQDHDGKPAFAVDSFYDVLKGKIPAAKYKDKIVLIGATASGVGTQSVTPVSSSMAPVLVLAHTVASILNEHFLLKPAWGVLAKLGAFAAFAAYLMLLLPRLAAGPAAGVTVALIALALGGELLLLMGQSLWVELVGPAVMLLAGHMLLTTKRFFLTEKGKEKADAESAETNRMLGLAFQGQGQLDMAFEKFRKCPLEDSIMDPLYNLALDYERKRQFNKAGAVYQYMADYNPNFRDLQKRISRSQQLEETIVLGGGGGTRGNEGMGGTMVLEGATKPMLGRYQVEKELGKGAMGMVYLGRDPKINRVVAIKTMALSQEFEADELEEVKERFFREAETAGRLNHPHIVTIYDAGDEHDLAYIAMEFLKGHDLARYTKKENRLPLPTLCKLMIQAAEALDYAHSHNVVHRDIKPANLMYDPDADAVKITDFGIARITDSSKTRTGTILGTPSYMSPEQLSGKRVDGRSDLFSLGVMLYQLTTGELPFTGDSMATLMFKIANEPHPDILEVQPDLPPCFKALL